MTDAVFSMDGDVADIPALLALCECYDALLLTDDAHGFGVLGAPGQEGRGTLAALRANGRERLAPHPVHGHTGCKAAGVAGAFVAGSEVLVEWLLQKTRSYIFATAAPALLAKGLQASVQVMQTETWRYTHPAAAHRPPAHGAGPLCWRTQWQLAPCTRPSSHWSLAAQPPWPPWKPLRSRGLWVPAICPGPPCPRAPPAWHCAVGGAHAA